MPKRFLKRIGVGADIGLTTVLQGLGALLSLATTVALIRGLGPDGWDIYSLALTYIIVGVSIADFGILAVVIPRLSVAKGMETPAFKAALVLRLMTIVSSLAAIILYLAFTNNSDLLPYVAIGYIAVLFSSKITGIRQLPEFIWRLQGRTYIVTAIALFDALMLVTAIMSISFFGTLTVELAVLALGLTSLPGFIIVTYPLLRQLKESHYIRQPLSKGYYKKIMIAALPIAVMSISSQLFARFEPFVIDSFMGRQYVGEYVAAVQPLAGLLFISTSVAFGIAPLIAQVYKGGRRDITLNFITSVTVRGLGIVAIGISAVCFLFADQIMQIFGKEYVQYAYILRIYSITSGLEFLVVLFDQILIAINKRKEVMYGTLLSFGIVLTMQIALIEQWGILGIMYAKICALLCKIAYQIYANPAEMRKGALTAFMRLAIPTASLALILFLTDSMGLPLRTILALGGVGVAITLGRTIKWEELKFMRTIRIT